MKNRNTTGSCAKAVGELRAERSLPFSSFNLGFQQVRRDQCAYHQRQQGHSSAHTRLGIFRDNSPSGSVPAGRCCVWATDSLKVSSLFYLGLCC